MLTNVSGVYENNKGSQIYVEGLKRYQKRGIRVLIDGKDACEETWGKLFEFARMEAFIWATIFWRTFHRKIRLKGR